MKDHKGSSMVQVWTWRLQASVRDLESRCQCHKQMAEVAGYRQEAIQQQSAMFRHQARVWNLMKAKVVAAGPQNSCPAWFELIPSLLLSFASMSYFCIPWRNVDCCNA